ncbi:50S ribosomal protein L33 [Bombilactobacillus thymidiniphilus]|uniref:Large ribosomal subunit protein bL33 n=1 Tax=Bombilactobacillus thymidiniphilus TaxID=2923363 RepID=A0ABY4PDT9_9LACO|nr:50S ribosomal protein L33 [Bombilactobacillus thymidiniphilus]UQS83943.1 50S ribosomal protein L33 [Bombilactobacillus thymidiniphilus]
MQKRKIILVCSRCGVSNYRTMLSGEHKERLRLQKYCPYCKQHVVHEETR